ncbi:hypothetical protein NDU88_002045 [Pleurodeles waltl]|uniref:Uncharacterized protein n=1 Tax=Pleurodeles waltl TaxID=8319 RepID=A0AAV7VY82_PLEWA|nr:hypothetical protein NDU88_002045 [Pleurodeles waltl]
MKKQDRARTLRPELSKLELDINQRAKRAHRPLTGAWSELLNPDKQDTSLDLRDPVPGTLRHSRPEKGARIIERERVACSHKRHNTGNEGPDCARKSADVKSHTEVQLSISTDAPLISHPARHSRLFQSGDSA